MKNISKNKIGLFSFFAGAGFLDLGFEYTNAFDILFVNEFQKSFNDSYVKSRESLKIAEPRYGYFNDDINKVLNGYSNKLNSIIRESRQGHQYVGFVGGPPCPDFSVAGKNKGRTGENGKLTETYVKAIIKFKPDFFLFENVKGLYTTKMHYEFYNEMKKTLNAKGYIMTERLVNSLEYGVPQNRSRIILIGFKKSILKDKKITTAAELDSIFPWDTYKIYSKDVLRKQNWPFKNRFIPDSDLPLPENITEELTVEHWFKKNDVANHPNSVNCFKPRTGLSRFLEVEEGDDSKKSFKRLHRWRYSPTVAYGNNEVHLHPYKPRRISVAEAMSLQSLPNSFILPEYISLTDMFKMIGNGVPYLLAFGIAQSIKTFLNDK